MKRALAATVVTLAALSSSSGAVLAHDPIVVGETVCRPTEQSPWTVNWTVSSDSTNPQLTWSIRNPGGYSDTQPTEQRPFDATFSRSQEYPASQVSATETVLVDYWIAGEYDKPSTRSGTVDRPPVCEEATTTTALAPTPPTSTTTTTPADPGTTTTSSVPVDATTTSVDVGSGGPTTTADLSGSGGTVTTRPPTGNLPATGGGSGGVTTIAVILLLGGVALVSASRRTAPR